MVSRSFSVVGHNDRKEDKVVNESGFTIVSRFGSSFLNATNFFSYSVWTAANSASISSRWIFFTWFLFNLDKAQVTAWPARESVSTEGRLVLESTELV